MGRTRVVLIGAGHAHLHLLRRSGELTKRGIELVLISPDGFWYSGLATGVLGGMYDPAMDFVDPENLLEKTHTRVVRDCMIGLERKRRSIFLKSGAEESYDILSIDVGSIAPVIAGDPECLFSVKPITNLLSLRIALENRFQAGQSTEIAIVGSGVTAFELAANMQALAARHQGKIKITIYGRGFSALSKLPAAARRFVLNEFSRRGIAFHSGAAVTRVEKDYILLEDGSRRPCTFSVNASGLVPAPLVSTLDLPVANNGGLITDAYLRCDDRIFAVGDCMAFKGKALPSIGVYAVRQAPVLLANILATVENTRLRPFRPQRRYLSIMNLGDGSALALYGQYWVHGKIPMLIKDFIDRRFMKH